jgi:hypothetical protein
MVAVVACGFTNHVSPTRAARRTALSLLAATQMAGWGRWTGRHVNVTSDSVQTSLSTVTLSSVHRQTLDHLQTLLETAHALVPRHLEGVELHVAIAEPDAEHEVALPDHVERRHALRHFHRVVQTGQQDTRDPGHMSRLGGQAGQERDELELAHSFAEIVLARGDGVPAMIPYQARHDVLVFEGRDHVASGRMLIREVHADFHHENHLPGNSRFGSQVVRGGKSITGRAGSSGAASAIRAAAGRPRSRSGPDP